MKSLNSVTRLLTVTSFVATLFITGCKKEDSSTDTPAQQAEFAAATSEADAEAEVIFDDVFDNVMGVDTEVGVGGTGVFGSANTTGGGLGDEVINGVNGPAGVDTTRCFTVVYTQLAPPARFPLKVVIDFGAGCTGRDGRVRKGKIIIVYSGPLFIPGNSTTTTFDGYAVNGISVEGTHKVTNKSTQNIKSFNVQVIGAKLTKPNGNFTQWNSDKTISQTEGLGTPFFPLDDVFTVSGAANGSVKREDKFFQWSTIITEPLVKKFVCRWIVKGTVVMRKSNTAVAELNYGSGSCDNKATLTVNGQVREITLH
jgi:hypothetical protein